jgi:hypothetical protein
VIRCVANPELAGLKAWPSLRFLRGNTEPSCGLPQVDNLGVRQGCEDADPNLRDSFYVKSSVMWNDENTAFASASIFQPDQQLASESSGNSFFLR